MLNFQSFQGNNYRLRLPLKYYSLELAESGKKARNYKP